jgi:integrase
LLRTGQKRFAWCGRTRNHYRAALSNVLAFAKRRGLLARDWNEMELVPKAKETDGQIGIYSAAELQRMLNAGPSQDLLPYIVVGAFCGARPSEITRLRWEDFHWATGELFIGKGKIRTAGHRVAPLGQSVSLWMKPGKTGPITKLILPSSVSHALGKLLEHCGVPGVADGLRHSFVSYRLAGTRSLAQVSAETGTSVTTLTRRYCRPVGRADAEAWFAVRP